MRKNIIKTVCLILALVTTLTVIFVGDVSAATKSEIQSEISKLEKESKRLETEIKSLKGQINSQSALKKAVEAKISNVQSQINACNKQINLINGQIAANKAEISKKEKQIEADKLSFKKRLRAIYMTNSGSSVQLLLGAEDFSDFLQLSQLTASVSAHDKKLIEGLVADIKEIEKKQKENKSLLAEQVSVKNKIDEKKKELTGEQSRIQSIISSLSSDKKEAEQSNADVEKELKQMQTELNKIINASGNKNTSVVYDGKDFLWPTPTVNRISSYYGWRWGRMHNGVDIANGNCWGDKVIAIADGVVTTYSNNCKHNYAKKPVRNCCGNGYGNYITINHGTKDGKTYVAYYAHLASITVSLGSTVKKGQIIGYVGSTGRSTGAHLHFGIAVNGGWANPMSFYKKVG